jgi:hypothetical protein
VADTAATRARKALLLRTVQLVAVVEVVLLGPLLARQLEVLEQPVKVMLAVQPYQDQLVAVVVQVLLVVMAQPAWAATAALADSGLMVITMLVEVAAHHVAQHKELAD